MPLIIYAETSSVYRGKLTQKLVELYPAHCVRHCGDPAVLRRELQSCSLNNALFCLVPGDLEELKKLAEFMGLLHLYRLVIVVPRGEDDLMKLAREFNPRFIGRADESTNNMAQVLDRMLRRNQGAPSALV